MAAADPGSVDVLIVGAGHNRLVRACYLAAVGLRVRVLDKRGVVGDADATRCEVARFSARDAAAAARLLLDFGALPTDGKRDPIGVFTKSAGHWLDATFESDPLKAVLGWDSVVGNHASPYAAGSAYVPLHHCFGEANGKAGRWGHASGGMGRITELMADEARSRGVQNDLAHGVQRVPVERGAAVAC